ncbi:Tn3 family transposase [Escherichia coli]
MTDTAGASELVFGLFWLLGYQFSTPADAGASVFWQEWTMMPTMAC